MARAHRLIAPSTDKLYEDANRQTTALAGLAVTLFLVVIALFLFRELHQNAAIEDCLMAGRANCDLLVSLEH